MHSPPKRIAAAVCLLTLVCVWAQAGDSYGHVIFGVGPVQQDTVTTGGPRLRLTLQPVSALQQAELRLSGPRGTVFVPVPQPGTDLSSIPELIDNVIRLGDLQVGRTILLDFEFAVPEGGGLAGFTLTGTLADGRTVQEAVGWTLARPGPAPTRRFGATEYPAVLLPERQP